MTNATATASTTANAALASAPPVFEVTDVAAGRWAATTEGSHVRIRLSAGTASFSIHHLTPEQSFVVELPDGEVEVRGTRFLLDVIGDRTRRLQVFEGLVTLRPTGAHERLVAGGETWEPEAASPVREPALPPLRPTSAPGVHPRPPTPAASSEADAAARFDDAVADFKAGRYAKADESFRTFLKDFPSDSRCEDAAYLRAVGRSRAGDTAGAAALADQYLARFPRGLRRIESERLRAHP
jgi:FecR protein